MPRRTGETLALTVIRSTRTWKNAAGGSPAGWDPVVAQTCHGLHVGLPGLESFPVRRAARTVAGPDASKAHVTRRNSDRSEEHTSELQSRFDLVCRLLLEKKKR